MAEWESGLRECAVGERTRRRLGMHLARSALDTIIHVLLCDFALSVALVAALPWRFKRGCRFCRPHLCKLAAQLSLRPALFCLREEIRCDHFAKLCNNRRRCCIAVQQPRFYKLPFDLSEFFPLPHHDGGSSQVWQWHIGFPWLVYAAPESSVLASASVCQEQFAYEMW